jgi:hypothetical protein
MTLGLAVLLALIAYVFLARAVAKAVEKKTGSKRAKYAAIAVFVLIPTWDVFPGWLYFNHLCEKEGGIKVLKTVEVDKSFFMPNGQPDEKQLSSSFTVVHKDDREYSPVFHIAKFETVLHDKQTNEVLGVDVHLAHYGGWLKANLLPEGSSTRCRGYSPYRDVWTEVIKPKSVSPEGSK